MIAKTFPKELRQEVLEIENRRGIHLDNRKVTNEKVIDIRRRMQAQMRSANA